MFDMKDRKRRHKHTNILRDTQTKRNRKHLETLSVNDGRAGLIILLLADPHLLEGGERGEDGTTDPDGILPLRWSNDLDLHRGWSEGCDLLLHTISNTWEHGGTSGEDSVGVQILTDINIALHDAVVGGLVDTGGLHAEEGWLEHRLWATESLVSDGDDLPVWELVALLQRAGGSSGGHLLLEV